MHHRGEMISLHVQSFEQGVGARGRGEFVVHGYVGKPCEACSRGNHAQPEVAVFAVAEKFLTHPSCFAPCGRAVDGGRAGWDADMVGLGCVVLPLVAFGESTRKADPVAREPQTGRTLQRLSVGAQKLEAGAGDLRGQIEQRSVEFAGRPRRERRVVVQQQHERSTNRSHAQVAACGEADVGLRCDVVGHARMRAERPGFFCCAWGVRRLMNENDFFDAVERIEAAAGWLRITVVNDDGRNARRRSHASQPASRSLRIRLTEAGLALPWLSFMTCPTKNPKSLSLPPRNSATLSALAAITASITATMAPSSVT